MATPPKPAKCPLAANEGPISFAQREKAATFPAAPQDFQRSYSIAAALSLSPSAATTLSTVPSSGFPPFESAL